MNGVELFDQLHCYLVSSVQFLLSFNSLKMVGVSSKIFAVNAESDDLLFNKLAVHYWHNH